MSRKHGLPSVKEREPNGVVRIPVRCCREAIRARRRHFMRGHVGNDASDRYYQKQEQSDGNPENRERHLVLHKRGLPTPDTHHLNSMSPFCVNICHHNKVALRNRHVRDLMLLAPQREPVVKSSKQSSYLSHCPGTGRSAKGGRRDLTMPLSAHSLARPRRTLPHQPRGGSTARVTSPSAYS